MVILKCMLVLITLFNVFEVEPEDCVVCSYVPFNAPCVVNTSTGDIWEMRVYPPHPNITNAIQEKEEGKAYGYCVVVGGQARGGSGISLPDNNEAHFYIRADSLSVYIPFGSRLFLCRDCLGKLGKLEMTNNFAVVDVYGLAGGRVDYYALTLDKDFWLRHYHILTEHDDYGGLDITVKSTYYEGGRELDY